MDIYDCLKYKTTLIRKFKTVEVAPIIVDWNTNRKASNNQTYYQEMNKKTNSRKPIN